MDSKEKESDTFHSTYRLLGACVSKHDAISKFRILLVTPKSKSIDKDQRNQNIQR